MHLLKIITAWSMFVICTSLIGQEADSLGGDEMMNVSSGEAHYSGKEIVLVGEVVVQHGLGQISAHRLSVIPSSSGDKKSRSALMTISDDVQIELQGGGRLNCQRAEIDYTALQGVFLGSSQFPDVCYVNTGESQNCRSKAPFDLEVRSHQMVLDLVREPATAASSSKILVSQVQANHNVRVTVNQSYYLTADRAFFQRLPSDKNALTVGLLTLSMDEDSTVPCQLTTLKGDQRIRCPGSLTMDNEKQEIILQSRPGGDEEEPNQVSIEDLHGEMHADRITIAYEWDQKNFSPNKIVLEGRVRLLNQFIGRKEASGAMRHYALADRVDYFPKKQEMVLKCTDGSRVLLFDKVNNVQMSAPSLTILRDAASGKETIRGLGDVRFSFVEKEIEQLNQFFRLQKSAQKESKDAK